MEKNFVLIADHMNTSAELNTATFLARVAQKTGDHSYLSKCRLTTSFPEMREERYKYWREQGGLSCAERIVGSFSARARLAMDDFICVDVDSLVQNWLQSETKNRPLFRLGLNPLEIEVRSLILRLMMSGDHANISQTRFQPMMDPHKIFGGPVRGYVYRTLAQDHIPFGDLSAPTVVVLDKRDMSLVRMVKKQFGQFGFISSQET